MRTCGKHAWGYLSIGVATLVTVVSLLTLAVFLYGRHRDLVDLGLGDAAALALDTALCLAFFVQHSVMIRQSFRRRLEPFVPAPYYGAFFAVATGVGLLVLVIFWQETEAMGISLEGGVRVVLRCVFFAAILGLAWSARTLRAFDIVGRNQLLAHLKNRPLPKMPFAAAGPYRFVRHPFYSFMLLMIWASPDISGDRLLFNGLWTLWVVVGTVLEEKDLVEDFGPVYVTYQQNVPMLIPWRLRP